MSFRDSLSLPKRMAVPPMLLVPVVPVETSSILDMNASRNARRTSPGIISY